MVELDWIGYTDRLFSVSGRAFSCPLTATNLTLGYHTPKPPQVVELAVVTKADSDMMVRSAPRLTVKRLPPTRLHR